MPKLTRLRLVSIGHPNARFNDLMLDFRDAPGKAIDSTIWLRNGGGKSSILNLFFALVRPNRRDFLGGRAEAKQRRIEDYVKPNDRAVVIAEWELDTSSGKLFSSNDSETYLTGVFYEWRSGKGGNYLRRLFFAARTSKEDERLTIEGVPLFFYTDGSRRRRTLSSFHQEWMELRTKYPHLEVVVTDSQGEWSNILESARIDPELFIYQVRMNQREGGVDELFRFSEHEKFIDFLLELIVDPSLGQRVSNNIATYRRELKERKDRFLPERDLLEGLISRLEPLVKIAGEREELHESSIHQSKLLNSLSLYIENRIQTLEQESMQQDIMAREKLEEAERAKQGAEAARRRSAILRLFAAECRFKDARQDAQKTRQEKEEAQYRMQIWKAAIPLRNALRREKQADEYREELEKKQAEHAPTLTRLNQVAGTFAGALLHRSKNLRALEKKEFDKESQLREDSRQFRNFAAECQSRIVANESEVKNIDKFLEETRKERQGLEQKKALFAGEKAASALTRLQYEIEELNSRLLSLKTSVSELRQKQKKLHAEKDTLITEVTRLRTQADSEEQCYQKAENLREELESDPLLHRYLELETIDLERMPDHVLSHLRDVAHRSLEQIIRLKIEKAEDERAVVHIEDNGLLPSSRETEMVLEFLHTRLPAAWSGWTYLEANTGKLKEALDIIERYPHLVTGVVVRDGDFAKAVELLKNTNNIPGQPVTIAPQGAFSTTGETFWAVIGPGTNAYFDKSSAQEELLKRKNRLDTMDGDIHQCEEKRKEVEDLLGTLREFRRQYPMGWFSQQLTRINDIRSSAEDHDHKVEALVRELERIEIDIASQEEEKENLNEEVFDKKEHRTLVEQFVLQYENHIDIKQRLRSELKEEIIKSKDEMKNFQDEADTAEEKAKECAAKIRQIGEDARALEEEYQRVEYLKGEPEAKVGPIDELRDQYRNLKSIYEEKVGQETLLHLIRKADEEAKEERKKLKNRLSDTITEKIVREALDKLADSSEAEIRLEEAEDAHSSALGSLGRKSQIETERKAKVEECREDCKQLSMEPDLSGHELPPGPIQAEEAAKKEDQEVFQLEEQASWCLEQSNQAGQRSSECKKQAESLKKDRNQLALLSESYEDLIITRDTAETASWTPPKDDKEVEIHLNNIGIAFKDLKDRNNQLDNKRHQSAMAVYEWARDRRFESLQSRVAEQFSMMEPTGLESQAEKWREELELRVKMIEDQLAEMNKHRDLLIKEALATAEDGLRIIKAAVSQSRLPDHVPGLGGSHFLRIDTSEPADEGERKGRIGELIDQMIDEGKMPSGITLVQQVVRRLARPIRVRVLNPDPDLKRQAVDIVDMARFSGGEQLTGSILLYCTLAQLRVRTRGLFRRPSTVLILDNPIGRASRVRFLELQREVARAMGVQLIYTTAVNDMEALRALPNIIRIRNQLIDRNTGYRIVEHDGKRTGIDLARIARSEEVIDTQKSNILNKARENEQRN